MIPHRNWYISEAPMFRRYHIYVVLMLFLAYLLPPISSVHAQQQQCFDATHQCISGRFLQYWQQNGGLPVFGYPIGDAQPARNADTGQSYLTQAFERNRFELHPENAAPYDVLLGRLGPDRLVQEARLGQLPPSRPSDPTLFLRDPACDWSCTILALLEHART